MYLGVKLPAGGKLGPLGMLRFVLRLVHGAIAVGPEQQREGAGRGGGEVVPHSVQNFSCMPGSHGAPGSCNLQQVCFAEPGVSEVVTSWFCGETKVLKDKKQDVFLALFLPAARMQVPLCPCPCQHSSRKAMCCLLSPTALCPLPLQSSSRANVGFPFHS